jgi:hypothetical protein
MKTVNFDYLLKPNLAKAYFEQLKAQVKGFYTFKILLIDPFLKSLKK